ncbi:MAG: hypothetical protein KF868_09300 [Acidobacteria bacterium]|nr:hypothetical protein [Acidobacteriota bacterium]MCW5968262.1 hypothetical protein [Blastocatellales bacterium]
MSRRTGAYRADKSAPEVYDQSGAAIDTADSPRRIGRLPLLAGLATLAGAAAVYLLRLDRVAGLVVDDAWYVLLAKALASGQGYRLINAPTPDLMPFYPPGFPFLLSFVFRIAPDFPSNVPLLKSVSILASLGASGICWWYFVRVRRAPWYFGLAVAACTAIAPSLVYISTAMVMSEPLFLLAQMGAIALVERGVQEENRNRVLIFILLGGLVTGFALLVRSVALMLAAGGVIYLLLSRHRRGAAIFVLGAAAVFGPWTIYSRIHAPTPEQRQEQNGYIVQDYTTQFWQRRAGDTSSGTIRFGQVPERVWNNLAEVTTSDAASLFLAPFLSVLNEAGARGGVSFLIFLFVAAGHIAAARERLTMAEISVPMMLGLILVWPWETFRFVIPLLPFAIFYLLIGLRLIYHLHLRLSQRPITSAWAGMSAIASVIILVSLYGNIKYTIDKYSADANKHPQLIRAFDENLKLLEWMNNMLPADAVVATPNPPLVYLYTGRRTIAIDNPGANWATWQRLRVSHLAHISPAPLGQPSQAERRYSIVYQSPGELNLRVVDLGPPESREPWGTTAPRFNNMIR